MASGTSGETDVLPKEDEDFIDFSPEFLRKPFFQGLFCLLWGLCIHQSPAVSDAVDVCINADGRFSKGDTQNKVCRFPSHSREFEEFFLLVGNLSSILVEEYLSDFFEPLGLFPIKAHGIDEVSKLLFGCPEEVFRTFHREEETLKNPVSGSVLSAVA